MPRQTYRDYKYYFKEKDFVYEEHFDLPKEFVHFDQSDYVIYTDMFEYLGAEECNPVYLGEDITPKEINKMDLEKHGQHEGYYFSKP